MKTAAAVILILAAAHISARPATAEERNACEILTRRDVAAVQGEAFADAKHSTRGVTSQCFYQLPSFVKSISLDLTREGGEMWREQFDPNHPQRKKHPPLVVKGIGDEAFWVGGHLTGSLYVRRGNSVLRVSVGGKGTEQEKIARSKTLAKKALRRM
jgi:hypothetical protein